MAWDSLRTKWDTLKSTWDQSDLWTPEDITTSAWYDAYDTSTITETAGAVSQWDDKSGNGNHLVQGTGSEQPLTGTEIINGLNAIKFDGISQNLEVSNILGNDKDYLIVFEMDNSLGTQSLMGGDGSTTYVPLATNASSSSNILRVNSINEPSGSEILFSGETSETVVTGDDLFTAMENNNIICIKNIDGFVTSSNSYRLGHAAGSYYFRGNIAEIVVVDTDVTNRQKVEGYLAHKWGFESSLPSGHPYKINPPQV